jgi:putative FmdB family regulatory protein
MPVYESTCPDCGRQFEVVRPVAESSTVPACPGCGSTHVERAYSQVYAVTSKKS